MVSGAAPPRVWPRPAATLAMVASSLAGLRAPRITSAPWSSELDHRVLADVTGHPGDQRALAGLVGRGRAPAHGVTAITPRRRCAVSWSPSMRGWVASGPRRPPASTTKFPGSQAHARRRRCCGVGHRRRSPVVADLHGPAEPGIRDLHPDGRPRWWCDVLADHHRQRPAQGPRACARQQGVVATGVVDRAAHVLLVHPHVDGPVAEQRPEVPARAAGVAEERRGRRSAEPPAARRSGGPPTVDLVDELGHVAVAPGQDALLV